MSFQWKFNRRRPFGSRCTFHFQNGICRGSRMPFLTFFCWHRGVPIYFNFASDLFLQCFLLLYHSNLVNHHFAAPFGSLWLFPTHCATRTFGVQPSHPFLYLKQLVIKEQSPWHGFELDFPRLMRHGTYHRSRVKKCDVKHEDLRIWRLFWLPMALTS